MKNLGLGVVAGLGLSLSACVTVNGVPTGNTGNSNVVTQYPVETAIMNIYTRERSQTLAARIDNKNITADITVTPKGPMLFNGKQVQGAQMSTLTSSDNQIVNQSSSINYYTTNPLTFHGFTDSSGEYSVATQTSTIPKLATVGDDNLLITENVYSDSSRRTQIGQYNQSWALERVSDNTAELCIDTSTNRLLSVDPDGATSECYKINARGDILSSRLTISTPTKTMTFVSQ